MVLQNKNKYSYIRVCYQINIISILYTHLIVNINIFTYNNFKKYVHC